VRRLTAIRRSTRSPERVPGGVTSLRALNAPFLITSDELLAEIVSSELAAAMLSGLDRAGLVGLALLPEGLRHPFGFEAPLVGPDDYEGKSIRTPTSNTTRALFAAFGATVTDDPPNPGTQAGMESSYLLNPTGTATGNITFYPKANALVVNGDVFADLDDEQRQVLEQAAAQTREWAIGAIPNDHEAAEAFCDRGGAVVLARERDVAALADAAAPVYAELERDPDTKALIDEIRTVKSEVGTRVTSSPRPCDGSDRGGGVEAVGTGELSATDTGEATVIDGTYRAELTEDELLDRGLAPQDAYDNSGLIRLTFNGGKLVISEDKDRWPDCHGVYSATRARLSIRITGPGCPYEAEPMTFNWTFDDGALRLVVTGDRAEDRFIRGWWSSEPWTKIQ
jgi:hypothetical protein